VSPTRRTASATTIAESFQTDRPSRANHILVIVVRYAGFVLMHANDGGINHQHGSVVAGGQCIHDPVPDASLPSTDKYRISTPGNFLAQTSLIVTSMLPRVAFE
jgi:hypothetical protein